VTAASSPSSSHPLPGYKLVISGDTQPCQQLVDAGADATLLVHEATLEDEMAEDARDKRHSTTGQAIEVGLAMRAERILLTHFSQRYPKLPSAFAATNDVASRTGLAFDLMVVRFRDLTWLPSLTPSFAWIFSEEELKKYDGSAKDEEKEA
jgi:ribonuclease Z